VGDFVESGLVDVLKFLIQGDLAVEDTFARLEDSYELSRFPSPFGLTSWSFGGRT
jgi:hypothetical protein